MLFNSLVFLSFILIFFLFYFATKGSARLFVCLIASAIFYGWWSVKYLMLMYLVIVGNYCLGLLVNKYKQKGVLVASLFFNLGILCLFKYYDFFVLELNRVFATLGFSVASHTLNLVLPVGISFYIFQALSYVIDVYRGDAPKEDSLVVFATYISFFPQLVAGPIVRSSQIIPYLKESDASFDGERILQGLQIVAYGFVLKVVIADSLALYVDRVWTNPQFEHGFSLLIACLLFSFQIYCDFNGYSKIAIGLGRIMGFDFGMNFNRPYFSTSFQEFWRRWHVSLSSWIRDYLYFPLGGSRRGPIRTYYNLLITMLLCGLWHGANITFVVWGVAHGLALSFERLFRTYSNGVRSYFKHNADGIISILIYSSKVLAVFVIVTVLWIPFRSVDIRQTLVILDRIASMSNISLSVVPSKFVVMKSALLCIGLLIIEAYFEKKKTSILHLHFSPFLTVGLLVIIAFLGTFQGETFIYFQF